MSCNVIKAKYFLIAPLRILEWDSFRRDLIADKGWSLSTNANEFSLKRQIIDILGMSKNSEIKNGSIILSGEKWSLQFQRTGKKVFSYYKGKVKLYHEITKQVSNAENNSVGNIKRIEPISGCNDVLIPDLIMDLYIAPNHKSALAILKLSTPTNIFCSLEEIVRTNYVIHKMDILSNNKKLGTYQAPILYMKTGRDQKSKEDIYGYAETGLTLTHILKEALPIMGYELDNISRFYTATYIQIDTTRGIDDNEITDCLIHIGQSKDYSYEISNDEKKDVIHLFENIWTYNSIEGFACIVKQHGGKDSEFIINSEVTFEKSYLPLFLTTLLVELTYTSALMNLDAVASDFNEQDRIREAKLTVTLSASHYDHLNRLMKSLVRKRDFDAKYNAIKSSIESRRLYLEQENQKNMMSIEKRNEERNRKINLLLGFIGLGQVVFAILQLLGVNNVLGISIANSLILNIITIITLIIFSVLIFKLLFMILCSKKQE